jgi:hypothetical protein
MKCNEVQLWLRTSNGQMPAPSGLRRHLYKCAACRRERQRVLKLDHSVRRLPVPPENPATRALLLERIGKTAAPMPSRRPRLRIWPRVLRWTAAAAVVLVTSWLVVKQFRKTHVEEPLARVMHAGSQVWIGPEDRATIVRVARHDVRLAETTDPVEQLEVLTALSSDLKDEALRLARAGKSGNVPLLTSLYQQVVRQGIVGRAAAVPADNRGAVLGPLVKRLQAAEQEVDAAAREARPLVGERLRPLSDAARETAALLSGEHALPAVAVRLPAGPAPLLTVLVQQGLQIAAESNYLSRADLCADLASMLAPAIVVMASEGQEVDSRDLTSCVNELLEQGVADNLDRAAEQQGSALPAADLASIHQRSAQVRTTLADNLAKVPAESRADLQHALEAVEQGNKRVLAAGSGKEKSKGPRDIQGSLKSTDNARNTIVLSRFTKIGSVDQTFTLAKDLTIVVDGKPARLSDLQLGTSILLRLSEDRSVVEQITEVK